MTARRDWDSHWLQAAHHTASMSTCISRKVGAVAVVDRRIVASGFNGNAPGADHCLDGGCPRCATRSAPGADLESCLCVHAEANVVAWAARVGARLDNATVYCTTRPCAPCALLLASAGITAVVFDEDYPAYYPVPPTMTITQYAYEAEPVPAGTP